MALTNTKGIHLFTNLDYKGTNLNAEYKEQSLISIPFQKISSCNFINNNEIVLEFPFEEFNERNDVLCEARFYLPPHTKDTDEANQD
jgi:structure-specific recognition protein 1